MTVSCPARIALHDDCAAGRAENRFTRRPPTLDAAKDRQSGKAPSPDNGPSALGPGLTKGTGSVPVFRGRQSDLEGEGQARSQSVLSGHCETTEGQQMEK